MSDNNIENILKLLEPKKIKFSDNELKQYITNSARELAEIVKEHGFQKQCGVAYTLFIPNDSEFKEGEWAPYSPSVFWGFETEDQQKIVFSSYLYYKIWQKVPPYTVLWNEKLSSVIPFNIQVIYSEDSTKSFKVALDDPNKIINIYFNSSVYNQLSSFLTDSFNKLGSIEVKEKIEMKYYEEGMFCFNFRALEGLAKDNPLNIDTRTLNEISNNLQDVLITGLENYKKTVEDKLEIDYDESIGDLSKVLIKLLLIGPSPTKALRLLSPKQFKKDDRGIGCFAGILRIYTDPDTQQLMSLYSRALSLISNIAFRITTSFMYSFLKKEADERLQREKEFSHLLYEFPHIIGNYVSLDIKDALKFQDIDTPKRWAQFMKRMGTYMSSTLLSKDIAETLIQYNFKETILNFSKMPLRLTVDTTKALNSKEDYLAEVKKWENMFEPTWFNICDSLNIYLPEGVLEVIFSNLLSNTKKVNEDNPNCKVSINVEKESVNNEYIITYQENNGKGFDRLTIKKLGRWTRKGPSEEEKTKGFGYRSMYKACNEISKGKMEIIIEYNGKEINVLDEDSVEIINKIRDKETFYPIHKFIFYSFEPKKLKRAQKRG